MIGGGFDVLILVVGVSLESDVSPGFGVSLGLVASFGLVASLDLMASLGWALAWGLLLGAWNFRHYRAGRAS